MNNLFDYITWRGDLDFTQSPFNPVDNIIFSQLSYLPLDGIVPGLDTKDEISVSLAAEIFTERHQSGDTGIAQALMYKEDPALISAMGSSRRFGNCRLRGYVNHIDTNREMQFSALCVMTGDKSCFIVYRGTDLTLVGWKEDFNMSFKEVIPAQIEGVYYLEQMASMIKGPLRIGGHSKGGNLAVYAAALCRNKIQKRITAIYSNDAPGFHKNVIASDGFAAVKDRIHSFVPRSSIVGMLLEHSCDYSVIHSSRTGLLQHELYSWGVTYNDMIHVDEVTQGSRFVDKTLKEWIGNLNVAQREQFFDALYAILSASQAKSLYEIESSWFTATRRIIKSLGHIDESTKALIHKTLAALVSAARKNIDTLLKPGKE